MYGRLWVFAQVSKRTSDEPPSHAEGVVTKLKLLVMEIQTELTHSITLQKWKETAGKINICQANSSLARVCL